MGDETETIPQQSERAEQLARLIWDIEGAIAGRHDGWETAPETIRGTRIEVADRIIREGWIAPELMEKAKREHTDLLGLYFDMMKIVGVEPDADFKSGPAKASELVSIRKHFEKLSKDRWIEIHRLRAILFELTGDNAYLPPGKFKKDDPGEVKAPAVSFDSLLDFASSELYDAAKGYGEAGRAGVQQDALSAAQAMLEIKQILKDPMEMVETLVGDRDMWQRRAELLEEDGAITTAALGQTQEALIDLTRGHDRMINLLERFARAHVEPWDERDDSTLEGIYQDVTKLLNSGDVRTIEL